LPVAKTIFVILSEKLFVHFCKYPQNALFYQISICVCPAKGLLAGESGG